MERSRTPGIIVTALGAAALIAALFVAISPIVYSGIDCGSILFPANSREGAASFFEGAYDSAVCQRETAGPRGLAVTMTVIGALVLVVGLIMLGKSRGSGTLASPAAAGASSRSDLSAELSKLADLRAGGALTAEEFDQAKRRLLGTDETTP